MILKTNNNEEFDPEMLVLAGEKFEIQLPADKLWILKYLTKKEAIVYKYLYAFQNKKANKELMTLYTGLVISYPQIHSVRKKVNKLEAIQLELKSKLTQESLELLPKLEAGEYEI